MTFVRYNQDGSIQATANWAAPGMVRVNFEVVSGHDGKLYKSGEEPVKTQEEISIESAVAEIDELEEWFKAHDYIGVKIATGRATQEEYADEIAEMAVKAARIEELRAVLAE